MAVGGYREKSGRSKHGYYKGIYCGSTYELCWVIYALDHDIKFTRFDKKLEKNGIIYYPDFLLDDGKTIIEPKGYEAEDSVSKKTSLAESLGYIVKILRKADLKFAFDYVEKNYGTKKFHTLYDDYKPKYNYICDNCHNQFFRDKKIKEHLTEKFCSRVCAGKKRNLENSPLLKNSNKVHFGNTTNYNNINTIRRLTKEQALYIYHEESKSLKDIADEFNLNKSTIWFIKKKIIYKWIHDNNDNFQPKSYSSIQDYKIERKNEKLKIIKSLLRDFQHQNLRFNTQIELSLKIVNEVLDKYSLKISKRTFRNNPEYRILIKNYLSEQVNF